jgi:hypothetical protein
MGSDQSWISYNFAKDQSCGTWAYPQAVSYPREVRKRPKLSQGTVMVMFHGKYKPWYEMTQNETPWVKEHWRRGIEQAAQPTAPTPPVLTVAQPPKAHLVQHQGKVIYQRKR